RENLGIGESGCRCPFRSPPFVPETQTTKEDANEVRTADPSGIRRGPGLRRVGEALRGRAEAGLHRLPGDQPDAGRHPERPAARLAGDGDHRPRRGRRDAHHRRALRLRQGGPGRLAHLRGRRPRRRHRARREDSRRAHGWRDRDSARRQELAILEQTFRDEWGRVLASLIGFLGSFELAEEAAQEAFAIAAERWPREGAPAHPRAWLMTTARHRAIDRIRRDRTLAEKTKLLDIPEPVEDEMPDETAIPDERLELLFTCCHPALALDAQVALTLRTLGGLSTDEIA